MEEEQLMDAASELGYQMLICGGEIYRVEESMGRMLKAYTGRQAEVFTIPNCIIATVTTADGKSVTRTRRAHARQNNLDKLDRLNDLCRRVCRDRPPLEEVWEELEAIASRPVHSFWRLALANGAAAGCFAMMFSGSLREFAAAFLLGFLTKLLCCGMERLESNSFFVNMAGSLFLAASASVTASSGLAGKQDIVVIAGLMPLLPGFALTNAMRDFIAGDLVAGLIRLAESLLVAAGLAVGALLGLMLAARLL